MQEFLRLRNIVLHVKDKVMTNKYETMKCQVQIDVAKIYWERKDSMQKWEQHFLEVKGSLPGIEDYRNEISNIYKQKRAAETLMLHWKMSF